jgi:hypothetical protein
MNRARLRHRAATPMPLTSIASEAWRNLCTGTARALGFAMALAAGLGMLIWADVSSASAGTSKVYDFVAAGASTYTVTSEGNVDGAACERLAGTGYVSRAGALREAGSVRLAMIPSTPVSIYEATPQLLNLLVPDRPRPDRAGVYLSPGLANAVAPDLGLSTSVGTSTSRRLAPVDAIGVYPWPDDGRPASLQYAMVGATPPGGTFDQCWVRAADPMSDPSFLLRSALVRSPTTAAEAEVAQLNPSLGTTLSAAADFRTRATRLAWVPAVFLGCLLGAASIWLRRLEIANAREVGVAGGSQQAQTLLETASWALAGLLLAAPAAAIRASQQHTDRVDLATVAVPILLAGLVGAVMGSAGITAWLRRKPISEYLRTR